ncbi:MAG: trypsin-like serine protease with C-terminal domain, partial [Planctomycetaceae bacterium]|nr:trypsin-like serine protease with C-terminal domain [Planctomycetaceae bacterium]
MNRVIWGFVCVCICLLRTQVGIAAESEQSQPREKYALLVGVTRYKVAELNQLHLEYPETDAQAIGEVLRKSGYKVDLLLGKDANQQAIRAKLKAFTEQGTEQGVALVGLFGLGCQVASVKADYFCPFDTTVKSENKQPATATPNQTEKKSRAEDPGSLVSLSEVLDALKSSPAGNRVLLADCRLKELPGKQAQPFASGLRARCREERIAMFVSCAAGQHAIEKKDQGHGKFSKCLLDEFTDSSVTGDANAALLAATLQKQLIKLIADSAPGDIQTLTLFGPESVDLQLCSDSDFARGIALFWRFGTDDDAALAL